MTFITQNANLLLLLLIVISATGLVGSTIYFQNNFETVNAEYNAKLAELSRVQVELEKQTETLTNIQDQLKLKSKREQDFTAQYSEVKGERDILEGTKKELEQRTEIAEQEAIDAKRIASQAEAEKLALESQVSNLNADLLDALARATSAEREATQCSQDLISMTQLRDACEAALTTCTSQ